MDIRRLSLLVVLAVTLARPASAVPEGRWLAGQPGVSLVSHTSARALYHVKAGGEAVLSAYRARLQAAHWRLVDAVYSGPVSHLRMQHGADVVDATLQSGRPTGKLTVTESKASATSPPVDKSLQGEGLRETWTSNGGALVIHGDRCEVTVKGSCSILRINGSHNEVHVRGSVAAILVRGRDNLVLWARRGNKNAPVVTILGPENVTRGE